MIKRFAYWLGRKCGIILSDNNGQLLKAIQERDAAKSDLLKLNEDMFNVLASKDILIENLEEELRSSEFMNKQLRLRNSEIVKKMQEESDPPVQVMQIDAALSAFTAGDLPTRFEIAAPSGAEFDNAEEFVEKVNDLKRELGQKGWHVRIYSRTENVWLFRNMPKSVEQRENDMLRRKEKGCYE